MSNEELQRLRAEIDRVDAELLALFLKRMRLAGEIGARKAENGLPTRDERREEEILARVRERAGENGKAAEELFRCLMALSRARQEELRRGGS